jgi:peptidoglycan hydrolase CwlO-like protein/3D (Asp-Asp-Asp) domain-containing protein
MKHTKRAVSVLATLAIGASLLGAPSAGAQTSSEQRAKVRRTESRVAALEDHLKGLISELEEVSFQVEEKSSALGVSQLKLHRIERETSAASEALRERAQLAYRYGGLYALGFLLGSESLGQFIRRARLVKASLEADAAAYDSIVEASLRSEEVETEAKEDRGQILRDQRRILDLRKEITAALERELLALDRDRATLKALDAARRDSGRVVSPAVEARRTARQKVLDQRLAALLAWYAPATGSEPFMPEKLKATGIVTKGLASWYGPGFDGRRAASGATYRQEQLTAASRVLPHGTLLKVTFRGKVVVVVITDRGPYIAGRVLDLSAGAAQAIGMTGVQEVTMEIVVPKDPSEAPPFP